MPKKIRFLFLIKGMIWLLVQQGFSTTINDTSMQNMFALALKNNPTLSKGLADMRYEKGNILQKSLYYNPRIELETENSDNSNQSETAIGFRQEIDIRNKIKLRGDVAKASLSVAEQALFQSAQDLLLKTQISYVNYVIALKKQSIIEGKLDVIKKTEEIIKKRIAAAATSDIELTKIHIEKKEVLLDKQRNERDLSLARNSLEAAIVTKAPNITVDDISFSLYSDLPSKQTLAEKIKELPQSQILTLKSVQADSQIALAKAEALSNPEIGVGVRHFGNNNSDALMLNLSIPIPLFDNNRGEIEKAYASKDSVLQSQKMQSLQFIEQAYNISDNLKMSQKEVMSYRHYIVPHARLAYQKFADGYNMGRFSFLEMLDAQRILFETQEKEYDALAGFYLNKTQADYIMGTHLPYIKKEISILAGGVYEK